MRQSLFHLSRDSARMFSGAAGLIAGFAAVSLPILVFQDAAAARIMRSPNVVVPALMLCLALLASGLLRFSLMRDDPLLIFVRRRLRACAARMQARAAEPGSQDFFQSKILALHFSPYGSKTTGPRFRGPVKGECRERIYNGSTTLFVQHVFQLILCLLLLRNGEIQISSHWRHGIAFRQALFAQLQRNRPAVRAAGQ